MTQLRKPPLLVPAEQLAMQPNAVQSVDRRIRTVKVKPHACDGLIVQPAEAANGTITNAFCNQALACSCQAECMSGLYENVLLRRSGQVATSQVPSARISCPTSCLAHSQGCTVGSASPLSALQQRGSGMAL